ncbi:FHA domain-containing protein [uncultured Microbacterium sp.]|uniref:FHA domain-containing protein n=1 Tax=uncultured Microbacterium sp. TaxID=191216 RepID=UPI0025F01C24|nr:FHA domain-containing protein [uncultured Microbacterium sp.]
MHDVRYAPAGAGWWIVSGDLGVVALAPDAGAAAALAIHAGLRADAGRAGIAVVLEALTGAFGTSVTAIPAFVALMAEGSGVRVTVRGDARVVAAGAPISDISAPRVSTWREELLPEWSSLTVELDPTVGGDGGDVDASGLPLFDGVARGARVLVGAAEPVVAGAPATAAPSPAPAVAVPDSAPAAAPADAVTVAPAPPGPPPAPVAAPASPSPPPAPVAPPADDPVLGDTVASSRIPERAGFSLVEPDSATTLIPDTVATAPRATVEAPEPPAAGADGDHDGETLSIEQARALRAAREHEASVQEAPPAPPRRTAPHVRLGDGRVVELDRAIVVGRRPAAAAAPADRDPHLVQVESVEQNISRSHVVVRAEGEAIVATDLRTPNGTVLRRAGLAPVHLTAAEPTVVVAGDVLDLGDGVTLTIEEGA